MIKTRKNRKSTFRIKRGGNGNWRPNRSSKHKPMYLTTEHKIRKDLSKYFNGDKLDLSKYQKALLEGSDEEKEEARNDLKDILRYLKYYKEKLSSYTFNVVALVVSGVGTIMNVGHMSNHLRASKDRLDEIKVKLTINDIIQTIEQLLKDTNVETTTLNPLVYKKVNSKAKNANVVERNGELVIKETNHKNRKEFDPTSVN